LPARQAQDAGSTPFQRRKLAADRVRKGLPQQFLVEGKIEAAARNLDLPAEVASLLAEFSYRRGAFDSVDAGISVALCRVAPSTFPQEFANDFARQYLTAHERTAAQLHTAARFFSHLFSSGAVSLDALGCVWLAPPEAPVPVLDGVRDLATGNDVDCPPTMTSSQRVFLKELLADLRLSPACDDAGLAAILRLPDAYAGFWAAIPPSARPHIPAALSALSAAAPQPHWRRGPQFLSKISNVTSVEIVEGLFPLPADPGAPPTELHAARARLYFASGFFVLSGFPAIGQYLKAVLDASVGRDKAYAVLSAAKAKTGAQASAVRTAPAVTATNPLSLQDTAEAVVSAVLGAGSKRPPPPNYASQPPNKAPQALQTPAADREDSGSYEYTYSLEPAPP
jgi:hypothetical protein